MDIRELKQLLKNSTSVLILDDGEPAFVVLDYRLYKDKILAKDDKEEKEIKITNHATNGLPATVNHPVSPAPSMNGATPSNPLDRREAEVLERLNKEILALKHQIETEERRELGVVVEE